MKKDKPAGSPEIKTLMGYLQNKKPTLNAIVTDGAVRNPNRFPLYGVKVSGAVLFADLPGFSRLATEVTAEECLYFTNHFFAWMEAEGVTPYGGVIDKFIGDELMVVFLDDLTSASSLEAALRAARAMLSHDPFAFEPKIGIAYGSFIVGLVGTESQKNASVMGHTVNIAARCVKIAGSRMIVAATSDQRLGDSIFPTKTWTIEGPKSESLKNVGAVDVIYIQKRGMWFPQFNYREWAREAILKAKKQAGDSSTKKGAT